jgi:hypothetical protein
MTMSVRDGCSECGSQRFKKNSHIGLTGGKLKWDATEKRMSPQVHALSVYILRSCPFA